MATNKEHLKLLLEFIEKILKQEGNDWFHDELSLLISKKIITEKDVNIKLSAVTVKEFGSINKYIEEGFIPIIDYRDIPDEKVRLQLERDAIEMGKCRLGNYGKELSYKEFCKYAHFQSEELVNYFFNKKTNGDVNKAIKLIKENNKKAEYLDKCKSISTISYKIKQYAIYRILNLEVDYHNNLLNISNVRNLELHRDSSGKIDDRTFEFLKKENYNVVYETLIYLKNKIVHSLNSI